VQWAVDGDNVALTQHLLKIFDTSAADLLLDLRLQWLVIEVEKLFAVERLQSAQDTFTDTANSNCTNNLVFKIIFVLRHCSDVPLSTRDLFVSRDEVAHKKEDSHDDVLGDGNDVGTCDFSNSNTAIGLIGSVQVDMIGANAGRDSDLELLGLREALGGKVAGVETAQSVWAVSAGRRWTYGVVMMTSASTSSLSNVEFSPSLSEVVTRVCP
jgi:hypothetical protein